MQHADINKEVARLRQEKAVLVAALHLARAHLTDGRYDVERLRHLEALDEALAKVRGQ
jgi:hypothetical protein